ncbi:MAG: elongation factor P maturation arginine rhamnosyltransferase EarP [Betaproteobacteria bacterium]|nr:elongation factor P maturation arginine rhamnosyltransferase EarP [Betaproteobacteria bacterium]
MIDNFGDAGVCWRLADALTRQHHDTVTLWIDRPEVLDQLAPRQQHVRVHRWAPHDGSGARLSADDLPDVLVEAFGCALPDEYLADVFQKRRGVAWINLEYLSAEPYVRRSHGLPSPVTRGPAAGLTKWFFYPGFEPGTGGVPWGNLPPPAAAGPHALLFGYDNPALPSACEALLAHGLLPQLAAGSAADELAWRAPHLAGRVVRLPFLPQTQFDATLATARLAVVRGEDSFVRAQLAARPFVWHIYPQHDGAHWPKLHAFFERYAQGLGATPRDALWALWQGWNERNADAPTWHAVLQQLPLLEQHALAWRERLLVLGDLTVHLRDFALSKLK